MNITQITYATPFGEGALIWDSGRLARLLLPGTAPPQDKHGGNGPAPEMNPGSAGYDEARRLALRIESYFRGERVEFPLEQIPVDWSAFSPFGQKVARTLAGVPYGGTISYAGLAAAAGHPGACRAAGNVMAKNPLPLLIPCHRVIRGDGGLGGFSSGAHWKRRLLELEGVLISSVNRGTY